MNHLAILLKCSPSFSGFGASDPPCPIHPTGLTCLTRLSLSASHAAQNLPAMQETGVRSLGQEDPLEEDMATHSSLLAWRISWTEEPGGIQSMG